jgi:ribosomal protein S18 acetylase RimI-like enzyme
VVSVERGPGGVVHLSARSAPDAPLRRARARRAPHRDDVAALTITDPGEVVPAALLDAWRAALADHDFVAVRTGALAPAQSEQAELAGWPCTQELALLRLDGRPARSITARRAGAPRVERVDPDDRIALGRLAEIDHAAFGERWRFDAAALGDVATATPAVRFRAATADGRSGAPVVLGFLVSGRAGRIGYVQRLAVHPDAQRRGVGRTLLADALGWMRRWHVEQVYVNTHVDNDAALALYDAYGFVTRPESLRVHETPDHP